MNKTKYNFNLLFISENESEISTTIKDEFEKIYFCKDKENAYDIFQKNEIDIVLINVENNLNWLQIVHHFRERIYDLPITIITDLDSSDRLTTAMTLNVNCIFKPINVINTQTTISNIISSLQNKKDAKELFYKKEQEKLNNIAINSSEKIIENLNAPMIVFSGDKVLFANKELDKLFYNKKININSELNLIDFKKLFENYGDENSFLTIPNGKSFQIKYHYKDNSLKKVFIPTKFYVKIGEEDCFVILLNDIAPLLMQIKMMEYQKNKLESNKEIIEELLIKNVFKNNSNAIITKDIQTQKEISIDNTLNDKEIKLLRKSISNKVDAITYVSELDDSSYEEVNELSKIEEDLQIAIDNFVVTPCKNGIFEMAKLFNIQGSVVTSLIEFTDLGNAICSLSDFLYGLEDDIIINNSSYISVQLENILEDLIQWRLNIFENQTTIDIHYLDSSIFSSVLQFQINISNNDDEGEGEGDLELF